MLGACVMSAVTATTRSARLPPRPASASRRCGTGSGSAMWPRPAPRAGIASSARKGCGRSATRRPAARVGISRSVLSAIERGIHGPSVQVFSRIAETLGIPMSLLAPARPAGQYLMKASQRPETLLGNGIRWLELAAPGHSMAPAVLLAAPGADSGGYVTLARENFITTVAGVLQFHLPGAADRLSLEPGDGLVLAPGQTHSWRNPSHDTTAKAIWIEQLASAGRSPAG